jgi:hypothetical protein
MTFASSAGRWLTRSECPIVCLSASADRQLCVAVISPQPAAVLAEDDRQPTDDDQGGHRAGEKPEQR